VTLVAGSAGHCRAKIYTAANPAGAYVTGRRLVTVIAAGTVACRRIIADTGTLVTAANVVALVAGRADNRV
jgi:hypothetical protein